MEWIHPTAGSSSTASNATAAPKSWKSNPCRINHWPHLPAPYCGHRRGTDQYGYVSFQGNYYWVPGSRRAEVKVLQYADRLKIYEHRTCVAEYPLPAEGIRNERFSPVGQPAPRHQPRHRQPSSQLEEKRLRAMGAEVVAYVDYVVKTPGIQRHRFLRELFAFSQQVTPRVFAQALQRALRYRVVHLPTVRRIAWLYLCQGEEHVPDAEFDENFRQRPAYQEGSLTDEPDLSSYDPTFEDPEDDGPNQPEGEDQNG